MRAELRAIQKRTGVTFIYITHDQGEALTMSDRVGVMSQGVIQQVAEPATIYDKPATPFVASFVGENNPFFGRRSEEHTSELQSHSDLVCRLLLEKKKKKRSTRTITEENS